MSRYELQAPPAVISECLGMVAPAEVAFRSRWRMSTLERVDKDLHDRVVEQIDLYSTELISGSSADLREQSAAMVRGWAAACRAMELEKHDSYLVGTDHATGVRVVISNSKQSLQHVSPQDGLRLVSVSPEEIAKLMGHLGVVALTKEHFPGAEIVSLHASSEQAA